MGFRYFRQRAERLDDRKTSARVVFVMISRVKLSMSIFLVFNVLTKFSFVPPETPCTRRRGDVLLNCL